MGPVAKSSKANKKRKYRACPSPDARDSPPAFPEIFEDPMSSSLVRIEAEGRSFPFVAEPKSAALLKQLSRTPKLTGVTAASRLEIRPAPETVSFGIAQVDALSGGLPRGCLTEVCGPESSGRTSMLLAALAAATQREEICTLIDASDAFHPHSAAAAGVNLERLLWIRCGVNSPSSLLARKRRNATSLEEGTPRREDPVEQACEPPICFCKATASAWWRSILPVSP